MFRGHKDFGSTDDVSSGLESVASCWGQRLAGSHVDTDALYTD